MDRLDTMNSRGSRDGDPFEELPWLGGASLFASGSEALVGLVRWGVRRHGWRRVWLPSYYCPDVPAALLTAARGEVELRPYPDASPWTPTDLGVVPATSGDVVVVANQLGVRPRPDLARLVGGAVIVEDHSHDPGSAWALGSHADYAFASLRKTLPISDGGALWSPQDLELPPEPAVGDEADGPGDPARRSARRSADRLAAALDARGRRTAPVDDRLRFRALARAAAGPAGAAGAASGHGISPVSRALLAQMPVRAWRERRRRNLEVLADAAESVGGARILGAPAGGVAFALTLVFDTAGARRRAQAALISRAVVPAVLWPLDPARDWGAGPADEDLSGRILSIHGDQRHGDEDMRRLAAILREALEG
jgi:hypothetical protein